jgi:hypothetical protein
VWVEDGCAGGLKAGANDEEMFCGAWWEVCAQLNEYGHDVDSDEVVKISRRVGVHYRKGHVRRATTTTWWLLVAVGSSRIP